MRVSKTVSNALAGVLITAAPVSNSDVEIRYCPLGPPRKTRPIRYAWCSECGQVRKSNRDCPMIGNVVDVEIINFDEAAGGWPPLDTGP